LIHRPTSIGAFEFVVLATLRAGQLMQGCIPRTGGVHKATVIAQIEVAEGKVERQLAPPAVAATAIVS
jgi:DNA-directed RNA polymerase subunit K/omega